MPFSYNAKLTEEAVWKIHERLYKIRQGNFDKDSQGAIAKDFGIEKKTVCRINLGKTWKNVKDKFERTYSIPTLPTIAFLKPYNEETLNLIDTLTSAKTQFRLDHKKPLHYGQFDWIDGVHYVATDGSIIWDHLSLFKLAKKAEQSQINEHPTYANKVDEIPELSLLTMFTEPVNTRLEDIEELGGGVCKVAHGDIKFFILEKYRLLAQETTYQFHAAGTRQDFIYLTEPNKTHPDEPIIHACIATLPGE